MSRTAVFWLARALVFVGTSLVIVGLVQLIGGSSFDDNAPAAAPAQTTIASPPAVSTSVPATSTAAPTTPQPDPTSATTPPPTTPPTGETVGEFVEAFAAALATGDPEFVFGRLHPTVINRYGEPACRDFIETEIMLIDDYRISGSIEGPTGHRIGDDTIAEYFTAPITFTFQDAEFDSEGAFAPVDGEMHWFTRCE